ncbi:acyltransferase family protein [Kineosporia succinea]|uniref:Peptidoglycan/LPS O-acetylase OafA/YrhL n=1 Tax=Kineosporia succinea TaxID=84632 RepID=A0ABT9P6X4_9ACTN|nr:acyltransferase [Kineosporia succinea]MDP9827940.1 peptidoglycan/LPS O-acetylase OafA/YrhL [Kineosporia succinea]
MTSTATLATEFDPRRNSLNLIRLGLATGVAVVHSMFLGFGHQPGVRHTDLGSLFVDAFFVISGFLVTRSLLRLDSLPRYLWHRALRILPGFWTVMVAGAFVVAPLMAVLAGRSATSVFSGTDSSFGYLINNAALLMRQFGIQGLPGAGGNPEVINGSLWTLFYEALCYLMVAALGVVGVLRRRPWTVLALIAALWWLTVATEAGINPLGSSYMLRFALVFLLGAAGRLFADGIPISKYLALGSLAVVVASLFLLDNWHVAGAPAFAYLVLYAVVRLPAWEPRWDLSYGMYVWHWPIAQLLVGFGVAQYTHVPFILLTVALAAGVAALSWNLVEKPMMGFKNAEWVTRWSRSHRQTPSGSVVRQRVRSSSPSRSSSDQPVRS